MDDPSKLRPPILAMQHFEKVFEHSGSSVAENEIGQFVQWVSVFVAVDQSLVLICPLRPRSLVKTDDAGRIEDREQK
jgi:hypothetical protein